MLAPLPQPVDQRVTRGDAVNRVVVRQLRQCKRRLRLRQTAFARNAGKQQQVAEAAVGQHVQRGLVIRHGLARFVVGEYLDPYPQEQ